MFAAFRWAWHPAFAEQLRDLDYAPLPFKFVLPNFDFSLCLRQPHEILIAGVFGEELLVVNLVVLAEPEGLLVQSGGGFWVLKNESQLTHACLFAKARI